MKVWGDEMSTAYLPGVGFLIDPQPADYQKSIRFLKHKIFPVGTSQRSLCDRLEATERRLRWTPKRLREGNG